MEDGRQEVCFYCNFIVFDCLPIKCTLKGKTGNRNYIYWYEVCLHSVCLGSNSFWSLSLIDFLRNRHLLEPEIRLNNTNALYLGYIC